MKNLQCNFTTPEQSKRLLELGVPAGSADCIAFIVSDPTWYDNAFAKGDVRISVLHPRHKYTKTAYPDDGSRPIDEPYPCWSVGRLIEIYQICVSRGFSFNVCFPNLMNEVMYKLTEANNNGWLNLSKLEE